MSQSESDGTDRDVIAEARAESERPGGFAGPVTAETDGDGLGSASAVRTGRPRAPRSLWRDRNFLTLWSGQAFSQFGSQIQELAIPVLAVLILNATELQVGMLTAAGVAAFLVVGLPAGAWIDRMRKRHVMIWADAVRALALGLIPLLWWLGTLQMWHLYAVALVVGIATVFFDVSYQSIIPSLVRPSQIAEANGKLQSTYELANIAGPGIGGWLIGILTAPFAILATVGTYVISFVALLLTRDDEQDRAPEDRAPILHEIWEGLRFVFTEKLLRRIVGTTGASNFFNTISMTMLPIFLLRELGLSPISMGVIFSLGAVGGLAGAIATPHIVRWVGEARSIPLSAIGFSVVAVFLPVAAMVPSVAFPLLVAQGFVASFTVLWYNITQVTFRQRITPPRLLGRMNASVRFVVWGVMPLAALLSGALGAWLGVVATMWIGALGQLFAALFVLIGPFWSLRDLPDAHAPAAR
ncbi:MFS transporter [Microbacterium sp. zg.B48]|uniref:MFS transporter n=1 Tax=unclassified Microbacterium TaxID=2609290 RepID=UPI00214D0982|nr:MULTISPECIES: MFS transporter [unclassified Microbacterium]MCR2762858.1 MFS transporter [Microbacterium sp. zg.B48]MCR2808445.1 MFS transporter [Microbacterium sp. zg.B185]WIM19111.1 MFS transporter [Microbacterium sp. zg-B185]